MDAARKGAELFILAPEKKTWGLSYRHTEKDKTRISLNRKAGSLVLLGRTTNSGFISALSSFAQLDNRGRLSPRGQLLDFPVGEGLQFFDDLLQPSAALRMILLRWQGSSLLGILLVESLNVTDLGLEQVNTTQDGFSSI
jgi:hypothetical protein